MYTMKQENKKIKTKTKSRILSQNIQPEHKFKKEAQQWPFNISSDIQTFGDTPWSV